MNCAGFHFFEPVRFFPDVNDLSDADMSPLKQPNSLFAAGLPRNTYRESYAAFYRVAGAQAVALSVHLFVTFYAEPMLRRRFMADEAYSWNASRRWPGLKGWDKKALGGL